MLNDDTAHGEHGTWGREDSGTPSPRLVLREKKPDPPRPGRSNTDRTSEGAARKALPISEDQAAATMPSLRHPGEPIGVTRGSGHRRRPPRARLVPDARHVPRRLLQPWRPAGAFCLVPPSPRRRHVPDPDRRDEPSVDARIVSTVPAQRICSRWRRSASRAGGTRLVPSGTSTSPPTHGPEGTALDFRTRGCSPPPARTRCTGALMPAGAAPTSGLAFPRRASPCPG